MKSKLRVTIIAALAAQMIAMIAYSGVVSATSSNNVAVHANLTNKTNRQCYACHGALRRERSKNRRVVTAHRRHLGSVMLKFECKTCHEDANLTESLAGDDIARKTVDPSVCLSCHGAFNTTVVEHAGGIKSESNPNGVEPAGCTTCHGSTATSWEAAHTGVSGIKYKATRNKRFCLRCHGGIQLFQATETN